MSRLNFKLEATSPHTRARATTFTTLHNKVMTPLFMPVGTQATVKAQTLGTLQGHYGGHDSSSAFGEYKGAQILLANTYHLLLRPGSEVFKRAGGIHSFMGWKKSVLTDSGGFQIFSLPHSRKMTEDGAHFQSYVDGKMIHLSPESSIEMQKAIGSDIMMVLDQCIPSTAPFEAARSAMELTHRWANRSLVARGDSLQSLFGIIQGACFPELRKQSAQVLSELPFDGFAIGGLAVGESKAQLEDFTELTAELMPTHFPRYLMGVGTPLDLLECVHRGVDLFDCILPTALSQRGVAFTSQGTLQLRRSVYKFSQDVLDVQCSCFTCTTYSRSYLHHLVKTQEVLGWHLLGLHNLHFYHELMREMRAHIFNQTFYEFYKVKREALKRSDPLNPSHPEIKPNPVKKSRFVRGAFELRSVEVAEESDTTDLAIYNTRTGMPIQFEALATDALSWALEQMSLETSEPLELLTEANDLAFHALQLIGLAEKHAKRPVKVRSLGIEADSLRLALLHCHRFTHLKHPAPHQVLAQGAWSTDTESRIRVTWEIESRLGVRQLFAERMR